MTTNTQGPWRTDATAGFPLDIHDHDNVLVARVQPCPAAHNVARRIVACVNACVGVSTEDLDRYYRAGGGIDQAMDEANLHDHVTAVQQRDQLLAALEGLLAVVEERDTPLSDPERIAAHEAIAAVKGGAA